MLDLIRDIPAQDLDLDAYLSDYWAEYERIRDVFWKFERAQHFRERGDRSWEAFAAGDWSRALELNEADRPLARQMADNDRRLGIRTCRIRIVESPISPYVQWEMEFFRLLAEAGQQLRVLDAEALRGQERQRPLPEVVLLGDHVLYQVLYDPTGAPCGARRIDDRRVIDACRRELATLFARAEPFLDFYVREVKTLPAPAM